MLRSYDFVLKGDVEALVVALSARGAELSAEGQGTLRLEAGQVEVAPSRDEGTLVGLEVRVPFRDSSELVEAVVKLLADVAQVSEAQLLDPQRGQPASLTNFSAVTDEYLRMARYAGEYGGVSEALGLSTLVQAPDAESGQAKVLLAIAVFLLALYGGWRAMTSLTAPAAPEQGDVRRP